MIKRLVSLTLILAVVLAAQQPPKHTRKQWFTFIGSIALNVGSTYLDMRSSLRDNSVVGPTGTRIIENGGGGSGPYQQCQGKCISLMWLWTAGTTAAYIPLFRHNSPFQSFPLSLSGLQTGEHFYEWHKNNVLAAQIKEGLK